MSVSSSTEKKLTGRHVLISVVAFFLVLILINGAFIFAAVGSFRGEDTERSYRQGLDYNSVLEARQAQAELGWQVTLTPETTTASSARRQIMVEVKDKRGNKVRDVKISGQLRHPIDSDLDRPLVLSDTDTTLIDMEIPAGRWTVMGTATRKDVNFAFQKTVIFE